MNKQDSFGIYERGHGDYKTTITIWGKQRERIAQRLKQFAKNLRIMREAADIIEEAKKNNPNNLPF